MPHRMSSLPVARYCGLSPTLLNPSGRAAVISTAFHARCADLPDAEDKWALLTDEERAELEDWQVPPDTIVEGARLKYSEAAVEQEVSLEGIVGHPDMYWVCEVDGRTIVFVADIKKSRFSAVGGLSSLQLHGYAIALVEEHGADGYVVGIWLPVDAEWEWGEYVDAMSPEYARQRRVIIAASQTPPEANTGSHCSDCWSRLHCPAYTLPAHDPDSWLAPMTKPGGLTKENAFDILVKLGAVKKVVEQVDANLKAFAKSTPISDGNGKEWGPGLQKGRESVCSPKELREKLGKDAERFIKRGGSFERYTWRKER